VSADSVTWAPELAVVSHPFIFVAHQMVLVTDHVALLPLQHDCLTSHVASETRSVVFLTQYFDGTTLRRATMTLHRPFVTSEWLFVAIRALPSRPSWETTMPHGEAPLPHWEATLPHGEISLTYGRTVLTHGEHYILPDEAPQSSRRAVF